MPDHNSMDRSGRFLVVRRGASAEDGVCDIFHFKAPEAGSYIIAAASLLAWRRWGCARWPGASPPCPRPRPARRFA